MTTAVPKGCRSGRCASACTVDRWWPVWWVEKKFAYDIWGDTVNLASRMESNGEAGQVNISGPVYAQVMDLVVVRPRGPIKVKGKGEVQMYFVERLRPEWSGNATGTLPNAALLALRAARMNG
jgi:hypothetical protein